MLLLLNMCAVTWWLCSRFVIAILSVRVRVLCAAYCIFNEYHINGLLLLIHGLVETAYVITQHYCGNNGTAPVCHAFSAWSADTAYGLECSKKLIHPILLYTIMRSIFMSSTFSRFCRNTSLFVYPVALGIKYSSLRRVPVYMLMLGPLYLIAKTFPVIRSSLYPVILFRRSFLKKIKWRLMKYPSSNG